MSMHTPEDTVEPSRQSDDGGESDRVSEAELAVLRAENDRLREQFQQAKRTTYRRTAIAFVGIGLVSFGGALLLPNVQTVLAAFGATGIFAAVLTRFITPETFHAASVTERIFDATAENGASIVTELGLQETRLYVPLGERDTRLYVPAHRHYTIPDGQALRSVFVVTGDERERGVSLHPTGGPLYEEFETIAAETADLEQFTTQLGDAVVEQFGLARRVEATIRPAENEARFEIAGSTCGHVGAFDQPVVSLLATGLTRHLEEPVRIEFPDAADGIVRCVWGDRSDRPDAVD
ncbi:hypothetical protein [Halorhabdus sp. BNX81]|uniref:hypothetical protein n=1 Tax=Halorhabdus sp. BNX81 TaxID=2980181 RepID=UPI0023DD1C77|nr:hypothetical protein [Halorhabdus sp. BNX81]WEL20589.1 putative membrane anchored protein with Ig-like domain [Halorhabdus sp. BNX81]